MYDNNQELNFTNSQDTQNSQTSYTNTTDTNTTQAKPQEYFYTAGTPSQNNQTQSAYQTQNNYQNNSQSNYHTSYSSAYQNASQNNSQNTNAYGQQNTNSTGAFSSAYDGNYRNYQTYTSSASNNTNSTKPPKKQKKERSFMKKAASFVALGLLFGAAAGVAFSVPTYLANQELQETRIAWEKEQAENKAALSTTTSTLQSSNTTAAPTTDVSAIATSCLPSVVSITNKSVTEVRTMFGTYQQDAESSGSGIIIGENATELLIVTNYHVVSGSNELSVVFSYDEDSENPSVVSAKLKGYVEDKDLAVISVSLDDITDEMRSQIKIATIGDSSKLVLGQEVVAIGNALGYGQSVTTGIISALNREVTVSSDSGSEITNRLIQTDAAINPGNSGGALLNMNGELIGINSVKVASSSVEGMGYAIPISDVQSIIEELMLKETRDVVAEEKRGYLGIGGCTDVTSDISQAYGMPIGIYVNTIYEDSPAEAAGLPKGCIITKFDNQTVKTLTELKTLLTYYSAGETVEVIAMIQSNEGYVEQTFTLTLGTQDIFGDDAQTESNQQETNPYRDYGYDYESPFGNFFWPFQIP